MSADNAKINATAANQSSAGSQWDMVMTRVFDAPRELVWKMWTDVAHLAQWWGPKGYTTPICEVDVRVGGKMRIHMRAPNGVEYPMTGVFEEIKEPERLVFSTSTLDEKGRSMFDLRNEVVFMERDGKTEMTLQARVLATTSMAPQYLSGMREGWSQSLDRLVERVQQFGSQ